MTQVRWEYLAYRLESTRRSSTTAVIVRLRSHIIEHRVASIVSFWGFSLGCEKIREWLSIKFNVADGIIEQKSFFVAVCLRRFGGKRQFRRESTLSSMINRFHFVVGENYFYVLSSKNKGHKASASRNDSGTTTPISQLYWRRGSHDNLLI